jgi:hypothetical protein
VEELHLHLLLEADLTVIPIQEVDINLIDEALHGQVVVIVVILVALPFLVERVLGRYPEHVRLEVITHSSIDDHANGFKSILPRHITLIQDDGHTLEGARDHAVCHQKARLLEWLGNQFHAILVLIDI